jgi:rhodanese-related sulfurtransferase
MAPFAVEEILGKLGTFLVYLFIGGAFGAVLEMAGFADSRRLAAQFYFRNMTVLKVMFGAIVVAMTLIFLSSSLGLLDYNRLWVNPTYMVPGIVGGLIMGLGFIIGGFCPGTSIVAVATLKLDGLAFLLGAGFGVFLFGETVSGFEGFYHSTSMGRVTVPGFFGVPAGLVVLMVVVMALLAFWGAERLERHFGDPRDLPPPRPRWQRVALAASPLALAIVTLGLGQPTAAQRWERLPEATRSQLAQRTVQIHPGELIELAQNPAVNLVILDVRGEADFNLFHLGDSRRVTLDEVASGLVSLNLLSAPASTVTVLVSNDEARASQAWKLLVAESVLNVYILEGGINAWLERFGHVGHERCVDLDPAQTGSTLRHRFERAIGAAHPSADLDSLSTHGLEFTKKVTLQVRKTRGGGCG